MLYDEQVFEDFKKKVNELGFDKVYKMSAATRDNVKDVIKEAARMLQDIPVQTLLFLMKKDIFQKIRNLLMKLELNQMKMVQILIL